MCQWKHRYTLDDTHVNDARARKTSNLVIITYSHWELMAVVKGGIVEMCTLKCTW